MSTVSLLFPASGQYEYKDISEETFHDLGAEHLVDALAAKDTEKAIIKRYLGRLCSSKEVARYRADIFEDIMNFPGLVDRLKELLDKIDFLKAYGSFGRTTDASGLWELMHRLDEMREYIESVEAIYECLSSENIASEGLVSLREHVKALYTDTGFLELKKDIANVKCDTQNIRSITIGVNLNQRFEAVSLGLVSVNKKFFSKSDIISNFSDFLSRGDNLKEDTEWKENYSYRPTKQKSLLTEGGIEAVSNLKMAMSGNIFGQLYAGSLAQTAAGEPIESSMQYMDSIAQQMLDKTTKRVKDVISRHVSLDITEMVGLIPELMYYVRWAELVKKLRKLGLTLCKPCVNINAGDNETVSKGFYNMKLALAALENSMEASDIVANDLTFDRNRTIFILTGANRGGKTTLTQAVGQLFLMAQSGVYVPGTKFEYCPVDCIFTHFPADEDKTMDLGRLGEECMRFKQIYSSATKDSLILLNETFSTTSYEEGYYIAFDSIKALRLLGARTIYNTHMHKLGAVVDELNSDAQGAPLCASLLMLSESGKRSYKVKEAPPEGMSYARDIAEKYGVTLEQLTGVKEK